MKSINIDLQPFEYLVGKSLDADSHVLRLLDSQKRGDVKIIRRFYNFKKKL